MKEVEVFDEENSIVIDDQYTTDTFDFFPAEKKFKVRSSVKGDVFYNNSTIEYKISATPIELQMRTTELWHEPPREHSIKDGVVLESEMKKNKFTTPDQIEDLKKAAEWSTIPIFGNYEVNLFVLSKHPEIVSNEEYRKFLRGSLERVKAGIAEVEEAVKSDAHGLQIHSGGHGQYIWYLEDEAEKKERDEYYKLPKEKQKDSPYGKKLEHVRKLEDALFKEDSPKRLGISEHEFRNGKEIVEYVQKLLDKKEEPLKKNEPKTSKTKGIIISLFLTLFLSWVVSWFVDINPFLIFILVQIIAFLQSMIGGWLERSFA
jgi:hypothetical protein